MKLIIDIPEEIVTAIQNGQDYRYDIHTAIAQGKPYDTSGDLISREALKETIIKICGKCSNNITEYDENKVPNGNCAIWHILNMIDNAPTVEPEITDDDLRACMKESHHLGYELAEIKFKKPQGEWEEPFERSGKLYHKCTNCHISSELILIDKYCPNCGARMASTDRDCENCVHHSDNGCESWECEFEKRSDV